MSGRGAGRDVSDDLPVQPAFPRAAARAGPTIRVLPLVVLIVTAFTGLGIGVRYFVHADVDAIQCLLSGFLSLNLLICYWEACLFLRRSYIETRTEYWRERRLETGRTPALELFATRVPWTRVLSPTLWADVWATYSQYDPSFADRRTFGFNADTANGFFTAVPTLLLYAALTVDFLPALLTGILGLALFWQWTYVTSVYLASFFIAGRHTRISRSELWGFVLATNAPWVLFPLLGLYVAVRLIVDGNYAVVGL